MKKHPKILLATDFSDIRQALVAHAVECATFLDAEIVLVHAIEFVPSPVYPFPEEAMKEIRHKLDEEFEKYMNDISSAGARVNEVTFTRIGNPVNIILETADETDASIIMIGARQRSMLDKLMGITAEKVIRKAKQAIVVVHPDENEVALKKISCAYDFSAHSNKTLASALNLCRLTGAELEVLNVVDKLNEKITYPHLKSNKPVIPAGSFNKDYYDWYKEPLKPQEGFADHRKASLLEAIDKHETGDVNISPVVLEAARPDTALIDHLENYKTDLLVIGSVGHSGLSRLLLGSTCERVLRKAPCSILVIKEHSVG